MKFFVKDLRVTRNGLLYMLGFQALLFLFGLVIVLVINAFINKDRDCAAIGSMMALIGTAFGGLARGNGGCSRYRMAICMGNTRRSYLLADPLITAFVVLVGIGAAWLLNRFELWLYSVLYPGWTCDLNVFEVFPLWAILVTVAVVCLIDLLLGAVQLRFGTKGFAIIWFPLCFSPAFIGNSVEAAQAGRTSLMAQIGRGILFLAGLLTPMMWAAVGAVIAVILVALSVWCYLTVEVRM